MQKFVVKIVSSTSTNSVVEIYRLNNKGRSSLTTVTVGTTPAERGEASDPRRPRSHREVTTISGSRPTSLESRAAVATAVRARKVLSALSLDVIRAL